jgi:hypothetical protein
MTRLPTLQKNRGLQSQAWREDMINRPDIVLKKEADFLEEFLQLLEALTTNYVAIEKNQRTRLAAVEVRLELVSELVAVHCGLCKKIRSCQLDAC